MSNLSYRDFYENPQKTASVPVNSPEAWRRLAEEDLIRRIMEPALFPQSKSPGQGTQAERGAGSAVSYRDFYDKPQSDLVSKPIQALPPPAPASPPQKKQPYVRAHDPEMWRRAYGLSPDYGTATTARRRVLAFWVRSARRRAMP